MLSLMVRLTPPPTPAVTPTPPAPSLDTRKVPSESSSTRIVPPPLTAMNITETATLRTSLLVCSVQGSVGLCAAASNEGPASQGPCPSVAIWQSAALMLPFNQLPDGVITTISAHTSSAASAVTPSPSIDAEP